MTLANTVPSWFNTSKGYTEIYYATTGLSGLTVPSLVTGYASGWYPASGTHMIATRIKNNGFQANAAGVMTFPTLTVLLVNRGGFTFTGTAELVPPNAGYYTVASGVYWSGGGAMVYRNNIARFSGGNEIGGVRIPNTGADGQSVMSIPGVLIPAGQAVELVAQSASNDNIYGDGINRRTFLTLQYEGPPLA